jgi:cation diffusion facilitator CzcD-associated flavoprotein CzcO
MTNETLDTVIVGSGFAGIGMACQLKQAGREFAMFERAADVAGVWRDNTYPNASSDIPAKLYSFSFFPKADWSEVHPPQKEIEAYLKDAVRHFGFQSNIKFNANVTNLKFIKQLGKWRLLLESGDEYFARHVILAVGMLNMPSKVNIKGIDSFSGESIHPIKWPQGFDATGKNVAVIGTGSSALQIIPGIAEKVKEMHVYQRSAPWVFARSNRNYHRKEQQLYARFPWMQKISRHFTHALYELRGLLLMPNFNWLNKVGSCFVLNLIRIRVSDSALFKKIRPTERLGCKRVATSSQYFPALKRENVELVTEQIREIVAEGVITEDGKLRKADTLITATGYDITAMYKFMNITGIDKSLMEEWSEQKAPYAYLGITVRGFPNLYFMNGPNVASAHTSVIYMMEGQMDYIMSILALSAKLGDQKCLNLKQSVSEKYINWIKDRVKRSIWSGDCNSWYTRGGFDEVSALWPATTYQYRRLTKSAKLTDYDVLETPAEPTKRSEPADNLALSSISIGKRSIL